MVQPENNIALSGDDARILMTALRTSEASAPMSTVFDIYFQLAAISQVQPPTQINPK